MSSKGINNYINPLQRFYRINGIKGIDWDLVKSCRPEDVKKTQDREYNAEEVLQWMPLQLSCRVDVRTP
jgi:hypothetical protein